MRVFRSALMMSLMASASPLAAQTALSDRPGTWIAIQPNADTVAPPVLIAPDAAPLITAEPATGVMLDATGGGTGVILSHPSIADHTVLRPAGQTRRPTPRPDNRSVSDVGNVTDPDQAAAIVVDASFGGPRPRQRPRIVAEALETPAEAAVPDTLETTALSEAPIVEAPPEPATPAEIADAAAMAAELAAELAGEAHGIMAAAQRPAGAEVAANGVEQADDIVIASAAVAIAAPALAPTPDVVHAVARMSPRNQPAALSAVRLPSARVSTRPSIQPAAFLVPRVDPAPVLSRPLPEGPAVQEGVAIPAPSVAATLSAVLMPRDGNPPPRIGPLAFAAQPMPDLFPYSALPPGVLPNGPEALARATHPSMPAPEAMAAVLMTNPRPAPAPLSPLVMPDMPQAGTPPSDPEAEPVLPAPDAGALARMISDAAICWQFANLSAEAGWARLTVEVALDEMNMPTTQSIHLTGFAHVMSSSAAEAFDAARGALVGCAEATGAEPATSSASLVFDRNGVRLR